MRYLIVLIGLLQAALCLYDTVLVGNTTYLSLRIGEFKKVSLPFNFHTYYSVSVGRSEKSNTNSLASVCSVEERQFDLQELDFLLLNFPGGGAYKDVVTQYDTLLQRRILVDMVVASNLLYVILTDRVDVVTLNSENRNSWKLNKTIPLPTHITTGKLIKASNTTLYFVGPNVIYKIAYQSATLLEGYDGVTDFESAVMTDQKTILVATRRSGVIVYSVSPQNTVNLLSTLNNTFFGQNADIADIQTDEQKKVVFVLNRQGTIIRLDFNASSPHDSAKLTYNISRSGCQNMEYFENHIYITCPELHRLTFYGQALIDKSFGNPGFNPKNIIFFNSIVILVGHNLAKVYNDGVQMGYYHDFLMRKILPFNDRLLIGSDYGLSLTTWDVSQLEITCGLKRKAATQKYEGKVSTTIDVVAECNQQYFKQNNFTYKQELKNDVCLYHFPISIDFWVGKQINYLPFKIGVAMIILVCIGVLIGWFILNKRVKKLTEAIRQYSALGITTTKSPYQNMVEQDGSDSRRDKQSPHDKDVEKQLHEIGD